MLLLAPVKPGRRAAASLPGNYFRSLQFEFARRWPITSPCPMEPHLMPARVFAPSLDIPFGIPLRLPCKMPVWPP